VTICEFYKNQFDEAKATSKHFAEDSRYLVEDLGYEYGSFKWLKAMAEKYFGGGYEFQYKEAGITLDQLKAAREAGYVKYIYSQDWVSRQLHQQDWWGLTIKGLRALHKAYKGQW